jgi:23S rRNA G2069 N7-methylase RlmK/C1962 C5-methylase RlmI
MKTIQLKAGKERSLQRQHPWIFESAIAKGSADAGETVRVESSEGVFLAWAAFSPTSRIRARVWSFKEAQRIDAEFIQGLIQKSIQARSLFDIQSNGMRLVHGESDGLPGLVVDRYGDTLVAQFTSCGTERFKDVMADALLQATGLSKLYERSDANVRALEGLPVRGPQRFVCRSMDGCCHSTLQKAIKRVSIWISATVVSVFTNTRFFASFKMCSIAIAIPVASRWRRWRVVLRM